jgi:hypothetical protein
MRHSNTGKSDPQPAPTKRGFFAAAGERLKRAMSGPRVNTEAATAENLPATDAALEHDQEAESEVTTSVQAKARELLQQDRSHKRGRKPEPEADADADATTPEATKPAEPDGEARPRKTSPPPLPWQRTAADTSPALAQPSPQATASEAQLEDTDPGTELIIAPAARARPKRPVRDSKSDALRARLGAAKAALAEAQAKRALETEPESSTARAEAPGAITQPELAVASAGGQAPQLEAAGELDDTPANGTTLQPLAAAEPAAPEVAAKPSATNAAEPIRTLTIARVLARQGYYDRSLSIYDALLAEDADDTELRAEADQVRAQKAGDL